MKGQLWEDFVIHRVIKIRMNGICYTCLREIKSCRVKNVLLNTLFSRITLNQMKLLQAFSEGMYNGQLHMLLSGSERRPWGQAWQYRHVFNQITLVSWNSHWVTRCINQKHVMTWWTHLLFFFGFYCDKSPIDALMLVVSSQTAASLWKMWLKSFSPAVDSRSTNTERCDQFKTTFWSRSAGGVTASLFNLYICPQCVDAAGFCLFLKTYLEAENFPSDFCHRLYRYFQHAEKDGSSKRGAWV